MAPSQPNEAMANIDLRRNGTISLDPSCRVKFSEKGSFDVDSKLFSKIKIGSKRELSSAVLERGSSRTASRSPEPRISRTA
jgi:hypothetical protein